MKKSKVQRGTDRPDLNRPGPRGGRLVQVRPPPWRLDWRVAGEGASFPQIFGELTEGVHLAGTRSSHASEMILITYILR